MIFKLKINFIAILGLWSINLSALKLNTFFLVIPLFLASICCAQGDNSRQIDSLRWFLKENPASYQTKYKIAEILKDDDSASALQYVKTGLVEAKNDKDSYGIGKGLFLLGNFYSDYGYPFKGEQYYRKADTILSALIKSDSSPANLKLWVRNTFNIGVVRSYQGFNEDIYYINKISPIAEKIGFYEIIAKANTNIAIGFFNNGQLKKSHSYFVIGGEQHLKAKDYKSLTINKLIFASCLIQLDSIESAKEKLDFIAPVVDSLALDDKTQLYHTVLAEYYVKKSNYNAALENLELALQLLEGNPIQQNKLPLFMAFIKVYRANKNYKKGLEYAQVSLDLAKFYQNKIIEAELYKEIAYFYSKLNNTNRAFENLANYVTISDSLNIPELEREIIRLETEYQSEKKEREILELTNQNNDVELQLTKKRSQNYVLWSISLGLFFLAGIAYLGYRNIKKREQLKVAELNQLKYEQDSKVYNAMLEGQENERKRLAIDLHDGLAGRLSATRIQLEKLAQNSTAKNNNKRFVEAVKNIDDSLFELRNIAMNLMPETLFRYGLKNAIEDYCTSIGKAAKNTKFILQFYDSGEGLSQKTSLTIYRIFQELINNAVKHAMATEVLVQYLVEDDKISITVEDNGKGFLEEERSKEGGMGLNNLKTRVAFLDGEIDFDSTPNEGTTVHIVINI